ncbi:MAG: hypothetical protein LAO20_20565 [Acidobacteriia bacterium]|nr:hypothetical protein [Terriglobia bacterium]
MDAFITSRRRARKVFFATSGALAMKVGHSLLAFGNLSRGFREELAAKNRFAFRQRPADYGGPGFAKSQ